MKSAIKKEKGLKRQMELIISASDVDSCFLKHYKKIQQKANISGFRRGKAPLNALKHTYKNEVYKNVIDELFDSFYPKVLKEHQIQPAGSPVLMDLSLQEGQACTFLFEVEVHPKIEVNNYLNLKLQKPIVHISEELVNEVLQCVRQSHKRITFSLSKVFFKEENEFVMDFSGLLNFKQQSDQSHPLLSGDKKVIMDPHFDGKKTFNISPAQRVSNPLLAGNSSQTKPNLVTSDKSISQLDGALDLSYLKILEEMRMKIEKALTGVVDRKVKRQTENNVMEQLRKQNPVEIPESLIKDYMKMVKNNIQKGKLKNQAEENLLSNEDSKIKEMARRYFHVNYLLDQLIQDLKMALSREDINGFLQDDFPAVKPEHVEKELKKMKRWEDFMFAAMRRKTLAYLIEKANIEKVESSIKVQSKEVSSPSS